jgi:hypothetical protein
VGGAAAAVKQQNPETIEFIIRSYIASTRDQPESDCPHLGGELREAWLEGWKTRRQAQKEWL